MSDLIAIPYIRFSKPDQRFGGSLSRQTDNVTSHIAANGWQTGDTLLDDGFSGFHGHHRRADRAMGIFEAEAREGLHVGKVLVVERLDRLSRETAAKTWNLISSLNDCGVNIATCENSRFYPAGESLDMFSILEILIKAEGNHQESLKKSKHIKREWGKRRERAQGSKKALTE